MKFSNDHQQEASGNPRSRAAEPDLAEAFQGEVEAPLQKAAVLGSPPAQRPRMSTFCDMTAALSRCPLVDI